MSDARLRLASVIQDDAARGVSTGLRGLRRLAVALALLCPGPAAAGWGDENWGQMLWGLPRIPALSGEGLAALACALVLAASIFLAKGRSATGWSRRRPARQTRR